MRQLEFSDILISNQDNYRNSLRRLLNADLNFHGESSTYASHAIHAFPAKFPPQLPGAFIEGLTEPGEIILDPMSGSGTTLLEANLSGRRGIGCDLDPLATRISHSKVTPIQIELARKIGYRIASQAEWNLIHNRDFLNIFLKERFDTTSREFVNYWFSEETQFELAALLIEIEHVEDQKLRSFFELIFSSIIITKSGGVSLARDLAHTRPHRDSTKIPKPAIVEFTKRLDQNLKRMPTKLFQPDFLVCQNDAQAIPFANQSIDLIVTSPPYASNAIDYMRANKFSLVWIGYAIDSLSERRSKYIGSEATQNFLLLPLPSHTTIILQTLSLQDIKKGRVVHRYFSEMKLVLSEMYRVLKPGKAAIVVVGTSIIKGINVETHLCLGEISRELGFDLVGIAERQLDRDRRMMPVGNGSNNKTKIEERMHQEYVLGLLKPEG